MKQPKDLSIAIAAGGTAGHINPALALAENLRDKGATVIFFGQEKKLEGKLVCDAGFKLVNMKMKGFDRTKPWTALTALRQARRAKKTIAEFYKNRKRPDVVVGFGAYIEVPLVAWGYENHIPVVLHEQNSIPGLANKMNANVADVVAYAFPQVVDPLKKRVSSYTHFVQTGIPVRNTVLNAIEKANREAPQKADKNKTKNLLVFGGSLGAQSINNAMVNLKDDLLALDSVHVLHATGKEHFEKVQKSLKLTEEERKRWKIVPYLEDMGEALGHADLILSRAGASSVAEIAAAGVPALLVPYPHARGNHQAFNARLLSDAGSALIVKDAMLSSSAFKEKLLELLTHKKELNAMRKAAKKLASADACALLTEAVLGVIQ